MPLKKLGNYVNSSRNQVIDNHVRQSFPRDYRHPWGGQRAAGLGESLKGWENASRYCR